MGPPTVNDDAYGPSIWERIANRLTAALDREHLNDLSHDGFGYEDLISYWPEHNHPERQA